MVTGSFVGSEAEDRSPSLVASFIGSDGDKIPDVEMPPLVLPYFYDDLCFSQTISFDHVNVTVKCPLAGKGPGCHGQCGKLRGTGLKQTATHGEWEPIAFLLAWCRRADRHSVRSAHVHDPPTQEEVDRAFEELRNHLLT